MYKSTGILKYYPCKTKLILLVDEEISRYYRGFIPKYIKVNPPMYKAHISIVRKQGPAAQKLRLWGKYEGEDIEFWYENIVRNCEIYYWLDAYSTRLEEIRTELGLELYNMTREPRSGFKQRWHITIANNK